MDSILKVLSNMSELPEPFRRVYLTRGEAVQLHHELMMLSLTVDMSDVPDVSIWISRRSTNIAFSDGNKVSAEWD